MKLLTIDLERQLPDVDAPSTGEQWILIRLHGEPLGILTFKEHGCRAAELARVIADKMSPRILKHLVADRELCGGEGTLRSPCPQRAPYDRPKVTVAVCTRDGADRLRECLDALVAIDYPRALLDLLVIDNAPKDDAARRLVETGYPPVRYVCEPRPGLDWARNRAILDGTGDIIAFTDDDVSVDAGWVDALARVFAEEPEVDAVTGLVVPDEMDVESQRLFEVYGGFGRGFDRRYYRVNSIAGERAVTRHGGAGHFGTGANMAFRRSAFDRIGMFDPALDVGTPTNGGGDLDMFFRVLKAGRILVYEPSATVRHRHRRTREQLREQLANNGIGFYSYLTRIASAYPDEKLATVRLGVWWFLWWNVRRLARSFVHPGAFPRDLVVAELRGSLMGLRRYARARAVAAQVLDVFGPQTPNATGSRT